MINHSKLAILLSLCTCTLFSQTIKTDRVITPDSLVYFLKDNIKKELGSTNTISQKELASYLRDQFADRYFYNWKTFDQRFENYTKTYPSRQKTHESRAKDHMGKFEGSTTWKLPFNYLNGKPVNAYALRHLARQHKMIDVAFEYHYKNSDTTFLNYFTDQMQSLNTSLTQQAYEKIEDGNGVYEAFRSGYRVLNWFRIHAMFLSQKEYSDTEQLTTIATLLQHGAHLHKTNAKFKSGNHQTRGLSALAMISILLRDFVDTDQWYTHAMQLLKEHLEKEINDDGFQFERTVHYHMSDINNYYFVYQLAKISNISVDEFWTNKLKSLFTTLTKIAYPDTTAPVLSDDTDFPWAEKNNISGALTLGYLLFEDEVTGYFANNYVDATTYWFLNQRQLDLLQNIKKKRPTFTSLAFPTTGYYVMREGWKSRDKMMMISAGLDDKKPDHQHGDMLGIQAMANKNVVLPNYQVRYSLKDLELFKNSMVKNVALVDNELQGKKYKGNKGGSGFGKFKIFPKPETITWKSNKDLDLFIGSHDGFSNIGVSYTRQVINLENDFWIVKDNFSGEQLHTYKQVWQGHYTHENGPNLLRSSFSDGSGFDIYQLRKIDEVSSSGARGKEWSVVSKNASKNFSFITVLYPFPGYSIRINEDKENPKIKGWSTNASPWDSKGDHAVSLSNNSSSVFFDVEEISLENVHIKFSNAIDVYVKNSSGELTLQSIHTSKVEATIIGLRKGTLKLNGESTNETIMLKPGDIFTGKL
ncbi:heparinase II/III family protein [Aquimarina pacifica]|uniref:heparinase II/III family protein n=1 Tax=Aquimarina pacifica TaxID=1296415 RepID=UPI00046ECE5D|nr:heparinase II/III family protein [Aquimarina pacifica]